MRPKLVIEIRPREFHVRYVVRLIISGAKGAPASTRSDMQQAWTDVFNEERKPIKGRELLLASDASVEAIAFALAYLGVANKAAYQMACWSTDVRSANHVASPKALATLIEIMLKGCYKVHYRIDEGPYFMISDQASSILRCEFWPFVKNPDAPEHNMEEVAEGAAK